MLRSCFNYVGIVQFAASVCICCDVVATFSVVRRSVAFSSSFGCLCKKKTNRWFNFPFTENVSQIDRDYHFVCKQTNKFTDCMWGAYLHMTNACFHTTMFTFYIQHVCTCGMQGQTRELNIFISYDECVFSYDDEHLHVTVHIFI